MITILKNMKQYEKIKSSKTGSIAKGKKDTIISLLHNQFLNYKEKN